MEIQAKCVRELLALPIALWPGQRVLNTSWVQELKKQQLEFIKNFGAPIMPGSFIFVKYNNTHYLVDGQHRYQLLRELFVEEVDLNRTSVCLETYNCEGDLPKAQSIYAMVNARYYNNGTIDQSGATFENTLATNKVVSAVEAACRAQVKANKTMAPYFDISDLSREINNSGIMQRKSAEEVVDLIKQANVEFAKLLYQLNSDQYKKCTGGLFLVYKEPRCRWFREIASKN